MGQKKTNRLQVLLTEKDRAIIDAAATKSGLDTSTWARIELLKLANKSDTKK